MKRLDAFGHPEFSAETIAEVNISRYNATGHKYQIFLRFSYYIMYNLYIILSYDSKKHKKHQNW